VKAGGSYQLKAVANDAYELELKFGSPSAKEFGVDVLCDAKGEQGLRIAVNREKKMLKVGPVEAPFELKEGEDLRLRVFIDKNLVEVFANDRQAAVNGHKDWALENTGASLFSEGGEVKATQATVWKIKTIYDGELVFGAGEE